MPRFSVADITPAPVTKGRFTAADIASDEPTSTPEPTFLSRFNESFGLPGSPTLSGLNPVPGLRYMVEHPVDATKLIVGGAADQQQHVIDKAYAMQHSPGLLNKLNGLQEGVYAAIPGIGPVLSTSSEDLRQGRYGAAAGGLTGVATQIAIGKAGAKAKVLKAATADLPTKVVAVRAAEGEAATKLARALPVASEQRQWIKKVQPALSDVASEARLTGTQISDGATLESAASSAVHTLDEKIGEFIDPYIAHPDTFTIDGNAIADQIMQRVPRDMQVENPQAVARLNEIANSYRRPISFGESKQLLTEKNASNEAFYSLNRADRFALEAQGKNIIDTAVADGIRSRLYPLVEDLAGPGMKELMQRQGAAIELRDAAHQLADTQAVEQGWKAKVAKNVPTSKTGAVRSVVQHVVGEAPNQLIKNAFSGLKEKPIYPTPQVRPIRGLLRAGYPSPQATTPDTVPTTPPPPVEPTTRALRKGLLLPEKTGAPYAVGEPSGTEAYPIRGGVERPKYKPPKTPQPKYELISEDEQFLTLRDPITKRLIRIAKTPPPPAP